MPTRIALDAMGADRAPKPEVEGAILAARHYDVEVLLVGKEDLIPAELDLHPSWRRLPIQILPPAKSSACTRRLPRPCVPSATRPCASVSASCARARPTASLPPATPALHGDRQDGPGRAARRRSSRAGSRLPHRTGHCDDPDRCRRQRRFQAGKSAAVRHHGRRLLPHDLRRKISTADAPRRTALHRRRRTKGNELTRKPTSSSRNCR